MGRKLFLVLLKFILLFSLLYIGSSPVVESTSGPKVWNRNTDLYYATIQEAINANETLDGHELVLPLAVLYEHVVVNKSVRLQGSVIIGDPEAISTIDGNGAGTVVTVEADDVFMHLINIMSGTNGIILEEADNSSLWALRVEDNAETGIYFNNSRNCTLQYSTITGNLYGISIQNSNNNTFYHNGFINNLYGIRIQNSNNNTFYHNGFINNLYGIRIQNSNNNTLYHNSFINNTYQVHVEAIDGFPSNAWDDGVGEGNYWSDYRERYPNATEIDDSDIWDTPYVINENNQDNYPIVPEFPAFLILPLFMIATLLAVIACRRKTFHVASQEF